MRNESIKYIVCALVISGGAGSSAPVGAQTTDCGHLAVSSHASVPTVGDIQSLSRCRDSGAVALVALWTRASTLPSAQQAALRYASADLRDSRIYDALRNVANDATLPATARLGALQVLTSYFDATRKVSMRALANPVGEAVAIVADYNPQVGTAVLPVTLPREYLAQLADLAWEDPDPQVRRGALFLRQQFSFRHPADTPLPAGAISLIAGCGSRVTIQSTADVTVPIDLHIGNAAEMRSYALAPASAASPARVMLSLPPGPIVATVGSRTVATLPIRNAPCHPGQIP